MQQDVSMVDVSAGDRRARLYCGEARTVMATLAPRSFDAVVTDPPYEYGFMGKGWDRTGVAFQIQTWELALRLLKPGGHLVAFGGPRTCHRMACAIEDAGFELRDMLQWLYGSGFPKSHDVSKAIDRERGAARPVVGRLGRPAHNQAEGTTALGGSWKEHPAETVPATDEAHQWQGWGTALKPAHEPIILARRPLEGTVAENVQRWGTGALNIAATRVGEEVVKTTGSAKADGTRRGVFHGLAEPTEHAGRWPANVVLDEEAAALLDEQAGERVSGPRNATRNTDKFRTVYGAFAGSQKAGTTYEGSTGGASRFFYTAKASPAERGRGNRHPTVKPVALMRWLVRLITPPRGLVLDPFMGTGTTLAAAWEEGLDGVGIDLEPAYCDWAAVRLQGETVD